MSVCVLSPGALTTVQDGGRNGYGYLGFNASGVMDERAYRIANALVGNFTDEAVLEMAMLGGRFEFTAPCLFAVTGADMGATLSGEEIRMYQTLFADEGAVCPDGGRGGRHRQAQRGQLAGRGAGGTVRPAPRRPGPAGAGVSHGL